MSSRILYVNISNCEVYSGCLKGLDLLIGMLGLHSESYIEGMSGLSATDST